jgi:predicted  nucleic acid-binding Zn-ribbon protein
MIGPERLREIKAMAWKGTDTSELVSTIEEMWEYNRGVKSREQDFEDEIRGLESEIDRLRDALSYYSDRIGGDVAKKALTSR